MGKLKEKICNTCGDKLTKENWTPSAKRNRRHKCKKCVNAYQKTKRKPQTKEQMRDYMREYRKKHPNYNKEQWEKHTKRNSNMKAIYYELNKEKIKRQMKFWRETHKEQIKGYNEKRAKKYIERTPVWADLVAIAKFYKNCPYGYHVDHIIPLQGKIVSGLHVLKNLQYLSPTENRRKSNKFNGLIINHDIDEKNEQDK